MKTKQPVSQVEFDMGVVTLFMQSDGKFIPPDQMTEVVVAFQRLLLNNEFLAAGNNAHQMELVAVALAETLLANLELPPDMTQAFKQIAEAFEA